MNFQFLNQWRSYYGSKRSMEPGLGTQEGPARDRQFFFILIFCFHIPICFLLILIFCFHLDFYRCTFQ